MGMAMMGNNGVGDIKQQVHTPPATSIIPPHGKHVSGEEMRHELKPMQQETSAPSRQMEIFYYIALLHP